MQKVIDFTKQKTDSIIFECGNANEFEFIFAKTVPQYHFKL